MTTLVGEYTNTAGPVFRIRNNSTLNLSGVSTVVGAAGFPTILVEGNSLLNIVDSGKITAVNSPAVYIKNSKMTVSNSEQISSRSGTAIQVEDSNVIVSNLNVLSGATPITIEGDCHVNLNRIRTINVSDTSANTCIRGTGTNYGSLLVQNIDLVDGSIQVLNMNVTLNNVRTVRTSSSSAAISFLVSDTGGINPKGNYILKIHGPTVVSGSSVSLDMSKAIADFHQVTFEQATKITDSAVTMDNSYVNGITTLTDSTLNAIRVVFDETNITNSHISASNCTFANVTSDASSAVTYHSLINGNIDSSNRAAFWLHNSKVAGTTALANGSSLVGSATNIVGSATVDASFFGSYGGIYGSVTTSNKGLALAYGSSIGSIDGAMDAAGVVEHSNVLSANGSYSLQATTFRLQASGDVKFHTGGNWTLETVGNYLHTVTGTYDDSIAGKTKIQVSSTYDVEATGATKIKTGATFDVDATGVVTIKGSTVII